MTLCFSQMQAGAVYVATKTVVPQPQYLTGYKNVFVSPFIGRLDDKEVNGAELVKNIIQMYKGGDEHVSVLASSVRSLRHMLYALAVGADIVTAPLQVLREWAAKGMPVPQAITPSIQNPFDLRDIPYEEIDMNRSWDRFDISHELTDKGIDKFSSDWNNLIKNG
jgi:transaldolase